MDATTTRSARGAFVLSLMVLAGTAALKLLVSDSWRPHDPAPPWLRAALGMAWCGVEAAMIGAVYHRSHRVFGAVTTGGLLVGLTVMTIGRSGGALRAWAALVLLLPILVILGAVIVRVSRLAEDSGRTREIRLFLLLSALGLVYLFSARVADGLAQVSALAAACFILAILAANGGRLRSAIALLERRDPHRVAALLWMAALLLLAANLSAARAFGAVTPQIGPVAPYQLAAVFIVIAVAAVREALRPPYGRAAILHVLALGICTVFMWTVDGGTLALMLLAVALVVAVLGSAASPAIVAVGLAVALLFAKSPLAPPIAAVFSDRVATRLAAWSGQGPVNDQMARVHETIALAGVTGHAGAARLTLLVGPQVGKDYVVSLVAAQGGVASVAMAVGAILLFLVEIMRRVHRVKGTFARIVCAGVFSLFAANALISLLWMNDTTPLVGIPAPLLARAGSHLTVAALAVGVVSFGTRTEGARDAQA